MRVSHEMVKVAGEETLGPWLAISRNSADRRPRAGAPDRLSLNLVPLQLLSLLVLPTMFTKSPTLASSRR
ncbi:hypothetical protein PENSPDRAFT_132853 [Peniophora sp. CONT]|nr:hypothetical protein PENSPDRAFT_132853 [Peniophora sp. CONT]